MLRKLILTGMLFSAGVAAIAVPPAQATQVTTYTVQMSGTQIVESPGGDPDATGSAVITIDHKTEQVCLDVDTTNLATPTEDYYIAEGAAGQPTGFVYAIINIDNNDPDPSSCFVRYNTSLSFKEFWRLVDRDPTAFSLKVHNYEHAEGAMRGQLS